VLSFVPDAPMRASRGRRGAVADTIEADAEAAVPVAGGRGTKASGKGARRPAAAAAALDDEQIASPTAAAAAAYGDDDDYDSSDYESAADEDEDGEAEAEAGGLTDRGRGAARQRLRAYNAESESARAALASTFEGIRVAPHVIGRLLKMQDGRLRAPTAVQKAAVPVITGNLNEDAPPPRDVLVHAETGSGKTLSYLLPLFSRLDSKTASRARLRAIIVTPTRELSHQVYKVAQSLAKVSRKKMRRHAATAAGAAAAGETPAFNPLATGVRVVRAVGEVSHQLLHEMSANPPHILIGTPTSLAALIPQHANLGQLQYVVLDEADELVRNHHVASLRHIVRHTTKIAHRPCVVCVSATNSTGLKSFVREHLRVRSLAKIDLTGGSMRVPATLKHYILRVTNTEQSYATVTRYAAAAKPLAALVFHNSALTMEALEVYLRKKRAPVSVIGNAYANKERAQSLEDINTGKSVFLLSTEMSARGLDLPRISHVINFEPPHSAREYVHRAGRAGRLSSQTPDRTGSVVTLAYSEDDVKGMVDIARTLKIDLEEIVLEDGKIRTTPLVFNSASNVTKGL
jgi:ATP-dependent RNA helicase DeaD